MVFRKELPKWVAQLNTLLQKRLSETDWLDMVGNKNNHMVLVLEGDEITGIGILTEVKTPFEHRALTRHYAINAETTFLLKEELRRVAETLHVEVTDAT